MNYGHNKAPSTYRSNHSVYSGQTGRSTSNLHSAKSKSLKSVRIPWYQKPLIHNNEYVDIQKTALITGFFTLVSHSRCSQIFLKILMIFFSPVCSLIHNCNSML